MVWGNLKTGFAVRAQQRLISPGEVQADLILGWAASQNHFG